MSIAEPIAARFPATGAAPSAAQAAAPLAVASIPDGDPVLHDWLASEAIARFWQQHADRYRDLMRPIGEEGIPW